MRIQLIPILTGTGYIAEMNDTSDTSDQLEKRPSDQN